VIKSLYATDDAASARPPDPRPGGMTAEDVQQYLRWLAKPDTKPKRTKQQRTRRPARHDKRTEITGEQTVEAELNDDQITLLETTYSDLKQQLWELFVDLNVYQQEVTGYFYDHRDVATVVNDLRFLYPTLRDLPGAITRATGHNAVAASIRYAKHGFRVPEMLHQRSILSYPYERGVRLIRLKKKHQLYSEHYQRYTRTNVMTLLFPEPLGRVDIKPKDRHQLWFLTNRTFTIKFARIWYSTITNKWWITFRFTRLEEDDVNKAIYETFKKHKTWKLPGSVLLAALAEQGIKWSVKRLAKHMKAMLITAIQMKVPGERNTNVRGYFWA
jgi:hypothetical protein